MRLYRSLKEKSIVSSVRVEEGPGHDQVHIWNRGGKAGMLTVDLGDGVRFARRLFGAVPYKEIEYEEWVGG